MKETRAAGWRDAAVVLFLVALVVVTFGRAAGYGFFSWDDGVYVLENPLVREGLSWNGIAWAFTHRHGANWHPLTTISHMLDCQLFGVNAHAAHLVNLTLHALNAVLLFVLLRMFRLSTWAGAFVAAVFAVHPLRAESVIWISERKDVLSGFFFMLALISYVRYVRQRSAVRYFAVVLFFVCGLMSKPMVVTLPFVLLLLDYWPLGRINSAAEMWRRTIEKWPLILLALASCVVTIWAQRNAIASNEHIAMSSRVMQSVVSYGVYIWQLFWPANLSVLYPHLEDRVGIGAVALALAVLIGITALAIRARRSHPCLLTGWLWFVGMLVPVIGIVQVGSQAHADRYTYLPHIGLCLALTCWIIDRAMHWRIASGWLAGAGIVVIAVLVCDARQQTGYWRDNETLWRHAISVAPDNFLAHASLAGIYTKRGQVDAAVAEAHQALALRPNDAMAQNELGLAYFLKHDANAAVAEWRQALQAQPNNLNAASNMAWVLATCPRAEVRDGARAVNLIEMVIKRAGFTTPMVQRTLAASYAESGRFDAATKAAQDGISLAENEHNTALAAELQRNLANYQRGEPLRDPALADVQP